MAPESEVFWDQGHCPPLTVKQEIYKTALYNCTSVSLALL